MSQSQSNHGIYNDNMKQPQYNISVRWNHMWNHNLKGLAMTWKTVGDKILKKI